MTKQYYEEYANTCTEQYARRLRDLETEIDYIKVRLKEIVLLKKKLELLRAEYDHIVSMMGRA